jgi:hypothetical protein
MLSLPDVRMGEWGLHMRASRVYVVGWELKSEVWHSGEVLFRPVIQRHKTGESVSAFASRAFSVTPNR